MIAGLRTTIDAIHFGARGFIVKLFNKQKVLDEVKCDITHRLIY